LPGLNGGGAAAAVQLSVNVTFGYDTQVPLYLTISVLLTWSHHITSESLPQFSCLYISYHKSSLLLLHSQNNIYIYNKHLYSCVKATTTVTVPTSAENNRDILTQMTMG